MLTLSSYVFYGWANPLFVSAAARLDAARLRRRPRDRRQPEGTGGRRRSNVVDPDGPRTRRPTIALADVDRHAIWRCSGSSSTSTSASTATTRWSIASALPGLRLDTALRVTLPLGISFYTFQSMSYGIDVYRGHARAIRNFVDFACFVSMFPQLVAGPIIRFSGDRRPDPRTHAHDREVRARRRVLRLGMAKKVLLANPCGKVADLAFGAGSLGVRRCLVRRRRPTPFRSISTSAATPTWRSAWA